MTPTAEEVRRVCESFAVDGRLVESGPYGNGHIHDTFRITFREGSSEQRIVLQRINEHVFTDPVAVMDNLVRVTAHLERKFANAREWLGTRQTLTLVPCRDGQWFHVDARRGVWRASRFIGGAHAHEVAASGDDAREVARAFGEFAVLLADLDGPPLAETIAHFHDLEPRAAALEDALRNDPVGRAGGIGSTADDLARCLEQLRDLLIAADTNQLPRRIVHNDCKINNVLIDDATGAAVCVIDLDTVFDGTVLADFGELVRTVATHAAEDEHDLDRIDFDLDLFGAVADGYCAATESLLDDRERHALALAGPLLTVENALRFMTDHLLGDTYFRVHRPDHNLDRCRAGLRLADLMLGDLGSMRATLASVAAK